MTLVDHFLTVWFGGYVFMSVVDVAFAYGRGRASAQHVRAVAESETRDLV